MSPNSRKITSRLSAYDHLDSLTGVENRNRFHDHLEQMLQREGGASMATNEAQLQLFEALKAHTFELEIERDAASGPDREFLDRRLEASRLLLEWLSKALEPDFPNSSNAVAISISS